MGRFPPYNGVVSPLPISINILLILSSMASVANTSILFNMFQYQHMRLMSLISRAANGVETCLQYDPIPRRFDRQPCLKSARRKDAKYVQYLSI